MFLYLFKIINNRIEFEKYNIAYDNKRYCILENLC